MFRVPFNPLVERLVGFNMDKMLSESLRFGLVVGAVLAFVSAPILPGRSFGVLTMYLAIPVLILASPVIAASTARYTARNIEKEKPAAEEDLTAEDVVQSYFMMSIYRLRWLVGSAIAACGGLLGGLVATLAVNSISSCLGSSADCVPVPAFDVLSTSLTVAMGMGIAAGALTTILMAAALGVTLALWRRRITEVSVISTVIVVMMEAQAFALYLGAISAIMSGGDCVWAAGSGRSDGANSPRNYLGTAAVGATLGIKTMMRNRDFSAWGRWAACLGRGSIRMLTWL